MAKKRTRAAEPDPLSRESVIQRDWRHASTQRINEEGTRLAFDSSMTQQSIQELEAELRSKRKHFKGLQTDMRGLDRLLNTRR